MNVNWQKVVVFLSIVYVICLITQTTVTLNYLTGKSTDTATVSLEITRSSQITTLGGTGGSEKKLTTPSIEEETAEITNPSLIYDLLLNIDPSSLDMASVNSEDIVVTLIQDPITKTELAADIANTISDALSMAISDEAKQALNNINDAINTNEATALDITKSLAVYNAQSKTTAKSAVITLIKVRFTAPKDGEDVLFIETIPKEMAELSSEVKFIGLQPDSVLQADPIFEFRLGSIKKSDVKTIKYTINKHITQITSKTVAVYKEKPEKQPLAPVIEITSQITNKHLVSIMTSLLVIALALMIIILYLFKTRQKGRTKHHKIGNKHHKVSNKHKK